MKLENIFTLYLREKKLMGLKSSTLANYSYTVEHLFIPNLPLEAEQLGEQDIYCLAERFNQDLSRKTALDKIILLNDFLKFAQKKQYIGIVSFLPLPATTKSSIDVFTNMEQTKIFHYIYDNKSYFHFGILLALYCGIRIGELSALQKKDINNNCIRITKTLQRIKNLNPQIKGKTIIVIDEPKTAQSKREIPILDDISNVFNYLYNNLDDNIYILTGNDKFLEPRTIERKFNKFLNNIGITRRKFHVLRHTFATNFVKVSMDIKSLSEILGHSSVKITLETYVHSDIETKKEAMKKFYTIKMS
jgi:integrase